MKGVVEMWSLFAELELEIWIGGWGIGMMMLLVRGRREGGKREVL